MKGVATFAAAALAGLTSALAVEKRDASTPITVSGNAFMQGTSRFYIRGVDYQPGGSSGSSGSTGPDDPLADSAFDACSRDIKNFQDLGLNVIRVYTVDNSAGHDKCMSALQAAGIYLILDVNSPQYSLNRDQPAKSYNPSYLQNIFATIDAFQKYDNLMAFFSGNEVINNTKASTLTAPYIKAVTRDMKQYIGDREYRAIPVGYSAADVESNRYDTADFLNCGTSDERSDFFAFNDYSWCDPSSYTTSGWNQKVEKFSNYSIPIFLSEYGCNTNTRKFQEVAALYGSDMTPVYSGGIVYEYSNEANNYGLGTIDGSTYTPNNDYQAYKSALANTSNPTNGGGMRAQSGGASTCPSENSDWLWGNDTLPAMPAGAKKYLTSGAGKANGLSGGSQDAGGQSTSWATPGSGQPSTTAVAAGGAGAATSKSAAGMTIPASNVTPLIIGGIWLMFSAVGGATLLL